ncbi:MAG: YdcF family protein [Firmicutes bacterium]|nr:YdcF family protein [Bacillota bacterium]
MERIYEGMSINEVTDFLFLEDEPQRADLIFVFGGRHRERAWKAVELFQAGYAPRVLFTGGDPKTTGRAEAVVLEETARAGGLPADILLTEARSANTEENVVFGREVLKQANLNRDLKKVILISAPLHMRRAKMTFLRYFPGVEAFCVPDGRQDVTRNNWWQTEEGRRLIFRELEKVRDQARRGKL